MDKTMGKVISVNESLVGVKISEGPVVNGEVAYIQLEDGTRLKSEVIDLKQGGVAFLQVPVQAACWTPRVS